MYSHPALNLVVETWIDRIIEAGGQTVIMPDEPDSLPTTEPVVTPRKANKRQRQVGAADCNEDLETTPRPPLSRTLPIPSVHVLSMPRLSSIEDRSHPDRDQSRDSLSDVQSTSTTDTNSTSRSGRNNPRKKEVALRRTLDWPVARLNITELKSIPSMLESLALDLKKIADGRLSLIPDMFRVRYRHSHSLCNFGTDVLSNYRNP